MPPPDKSNTLVYQAYRAASSVLTPVIPFVLRSRAAKGKEDTARIGERLGHAAIPRPEGTLIWIHGASVGECLAALPLIGKLTRAGQNVLLTSGTVTSAQLMAERLPRNAIHQFVPVDTPSAVRRFLDHWKPEIALFVESELWPNMVLQTARRGIPMALVNARLSTRSFEGWKRAPKFARNILSSFTVCLAQDALVASRLTELGARDVRITGSLKADAPPLPADDAALWKMRAALDGRPVFLAASTHPGEDDAVLRAAGALCTRLPQGLTIIVPRHPERGPALEAIARGHGFETARRSEGHLPSKATQIYVADTLGELGLFYRLAPFAFLGGSLIEHGGQNPLEAARLGTPVLAGPHTENFAEIFSALLKTQGDGLVHNAAELGEKVVNILCNPDYAASMAKAAKDVVDQMGGALDATLAAIADMKKHARA